jgi:chromosomal replication initiator protein
VEGIERFCKLPRGSSQEVPSYIKEFSSDKLHQESGIDCPERNNTDQFGRAFTGEFGGTTNGRFHSDAGAEFVKALHARLGQSVFEMYFGDPASISVDNGRVCVHAENDFLRQRLVEKFGSQIRSVADSFLGERWRVEFLVTTSVKQANPEQSSSRDMGNGSMRAGIDRGHEVSSDRDNSWLGTTLTDSICPQQSELFEPAIKRRARREPGNPLRHGGLESFWFGENNGIAQASAMQLLEHFGQYSPLLVYGPTGCGKSHLLEGMVATARKRLKLRRCVYLSAEQFTAYFVQALRGTGLPLFRRKYRDLDVLAIDDIHFFAGKTATLAEFQHTIDNLMRHGKQVILASDRTPLELSRLGTEVATRLTGGLICPLNYPDVEGRRRILRRMCQQREFEVPAGVIDLIANQIARDVRRLSGAINRIHAVSVATKSKITLEIAHQVLGDLFSVTHAAASLVAVEKAVCEFCGVKPSDLKSGSRRKSIISARMLAMYLSRRYTSNAFSEIGEYFGGRSHSTVIAAQKKVDRWVEENSPIQLPNAKYPAKEVVSRIETALRVG